MGGSPQEAGAGCCLRAEVSVAGSCVNRLNSLSVSSHSHTEISLPFQQYSELDLHRWSDQGGSALLDG
jgi:hypothetical protein